MSTSSLRAGATRVSRTKRFPQLGPADPGYSPSPCVCMDPECAQDLFRLDCGVASKRTRETMRLTTAPWPNKRLKSTTRVHYRGAAASDNIGYAAVGQPGGDETWALTWAQTKTQVYGSHDFIAAGRRGDAIYDGADDEDPTAAKPPQRRTYDIEY